MNLVVLCDLVSCFFIWAGWLVRAKKSKELKIYKRGAHMISSIPYEIDQNPYRKLPACQSKASFLEISEREPS